MTLTADPLTDPVTPADLLAQVRVARAERDAADTRIALLAVEWAAAHPCLRTHPAPTYQELVEAETEDAQDPQELEWHGVPAVRWDGFASFAAALGLSTTAGKNLVRDVLITRHRLPRLWDRFADGQVPLRRIRQVAQAVLGQPDDVCRYLDQQVAHRAETLGPVTLDRVLDEAKLRLHAEERELEQLEALDSRYARLDPATTNHTGIAEMALRADWPDLAAFDQTIGHLAAALARDGSTDSLDVRRSLAVGIIADPQRAHTLLTGSKAAKPKPKRTIMLTYQLTDATLLGIDPIGFDTDGRPLLDQLVRQWAARDDMHITIQPLLNLGACTNTSTGKSKKHAGHAVEDYRPNRAAQLEVQLRDRTCVHPHCNRPARRCDCDHIVPHNRGGPTCPCNLAPLCRHHHRLKTHAGWRYRHLAPSTYLWTDPHGQRFLRTPDGTHDLN